MLRNFMRMNPIFKYISSSFFFLVMAGICFLIVPESMAFSKKSCVTVMSRNLYIGADIFRVIEAANNPGQGELSIPMAVAEVFQTIQYTRFIERVEAIVDEIQKYKPHLVGLQEVSTILSQTPGDFILGNPTPATDVVYDYQKILLEALAARKLKYSVAAAVTNADVELPMLAGLDENGAPVLNDIRLVDHDIILVRKDVSYDNPLEQNFSTNISLSLAGSTVEFTRGYTVVDAQVKDAAFCFANTHLEVYGGENDAFSAVQSAQMNELLTILDNRQLPVILLGDLNSPPEDTIRISELYGEIVPPYLQATAAGYVDLAMRSKKTPKLTCCFNETIDDPLAALYERIDHILLLPEKSIALPRIKFKVIGDKVRDMTTSGLWPSDHAGVVAKILF